MFNCSQLWRSKEIPQFPASSHSPPAPKTRAVRFKSFQLVQSIIVGTSPLPPTSGDFSTHLLDRLLVFGDHDLQAQLCNCEIADAVYSLNEGAINTPQVQKCWIIAHLQEKGHQGKIAKILDAYPKTPIVLIADKFQEASWLYRAHCLFLCHQKNRMAEKCKALIQIISACTTNPTQTLDRVTSIQKKHAFLLKRKDLETITNQNDWISPTHLEGIDTQQFAHIQEVIPQLSNNPPDLVVIAGKYEDYLNPIELAQIIRQHFSGPIILNTTGVTFHINAHQTSRLNPTLCEAYQEKFSPIRLIPSPFVPEFLQRIIQNLLKPNPTSPPTSSRASSPLHVASFRSTNDM